MNSSLGIAIVGTGMISEVHRRAIVASGSKLVGVLGSSTKRSSAAAEQWGCRNYANFSELLNDPAVQVVHICTPNALHFEMARECLLAGKHVVCEKPLATKVEHALELTALATKSGLVTAVPHVYRYHPMVREARARILNGEVGQLSLIHGSYLQDWLQGAKDTNWRVDVAQGGPSRAFADIGSHWCDLIEWVTGERFISVTASFVTVQSQRPQSTRGTFSKEGTEGPLVEVSTEDIACALLRTDRNTLANVSISQVAPGRKNRLWFEIDGADQSLVFDQEIPDQLWVGQRDCTKLYVKDPSQGSAEQRRLAILPAGHAQGYNECFNAFVNDTYAAVHGARPEGLPDFSDGLRSALLTQAVITSAKTGAWTSISDHT